MASDKDKDGTQARNLYQRLAAVQAEIEAVPKTGRNVAFSYAYIEQGLVMAALRPKLAAHGVVLVPRILGSVQTVGTTQKGGQQITERVSVEFTLVNADDPTDTLVVPWLAEGQDSTDKAINKAIVAAQKYMLMKLFLISDADDPDGAGEETAKPAGHREHTAVPHGQRRQPLPAVARKDKDKDKDVDPRRPALDRAAEEMAAQTQAQAEAGLNGTSPPTPVPSARKSAWEALKAACRAIGLEEPSTLRQVNALAAQYGLPHTENLAGVTTAWLDDVRRALPRAKQSQPQGGPQTEQAKREQALAGWIAAAPDEATLTQLRSDVMGALKAGSLTEGAAEALLEAVAGRSGELDLYPQATESADASAAARAETGLARAGDAVRAVSRRGQGGQGGAEEATGPATVSG